MHKNPFGPQPTYTPAPQPPLPPGPPPPPSSQQNYAAAYWANAAAAQAQAQAAPQHYNGQWTAPTTGQGAPATQAAPTTAAPAQPQPDQAALYANYGYGQQWHQQQQRAAQAQAHAQVPPPPPVYSQPQPPAAPSPYNPYQPYAAQPYAPPTAPAVPPPAPPMQQQQPFPTQQPQARPYYPPQPPQPQPPQQPRHNVQHTPPQHMPPAKRQRFDSGARPSGPPPPQPQFQAPQAPAGPMMPQGMNGGSFDNGRGGAPGPMGRGGMQMRGGPRGRGSGPMNNMRGGAGRGRGGSFTQRGGSQGGGFAKPHNARGNFGSKDFGNRRGGGSFNNGSNFGGGHQGFQGSQNHHQGGRDNASFRGRANFQNHSHRGRQDGGSFSHRERDASSTSSNFVAPGSSKKEENRRTLTDFKIVGLEIRELSWTWGELSSVGSVPSDAAKVEEGADTSSATAPAASSAEDVAVKEQLVVKTEGAAGRETVPSGAEASATAPSEEAHATDSSAVLAGLAQPPCRMRLYFHSPVTPEDARPIPAGAGTVFASEDGSARKGKRKKLEDDDGDDERRAPPPPPGGMHERDRSVTAIDRGSVAPSVAETASEGDWLMAAIGEDPDLDAEGETDDELHVSEAYEGGHPERAEGEQFQQAEGDHGGSQIGMGTQEDSQAADNSGAQPETDVSGTAEAAPPADASAEQHAAAASPATEPPQSVVSPSSPVRVQANAVTPTHEAIVSASETAPVGGAQATDPSHSAENSAATTEPTDSQPDGTQPSAGDVSIVTDDSAGTQVETQPDTAYEGSTLASFSGAPSATPPVATYGELNQLPLPAKEESDSRTPSANRVSISYASGTKRLVIDAEVVSKLKLYRAEGRIEIALKLERLGTLELRGILVETLSETTKLFTPIEILTSAAESDVTVPPFSKVELPSELTLHVHLDTDRPLSEPRWARTGDIHEWLKSLLGGRFWVAGDASSRWESKIEVVDPDPAPTIWTALDQWAGMSTVGSQTERQRFVKTHLSEPDNLLEILLRLVRGERATAFSAAAPAISAPSVSGPLLTALNGASAHGAQQTHVSLAVLAMFRLTIEYAERASGTKGKTEAEERVGEILRCLPTHLLYKSLEGIFKEWKAETKRSGR